ncbi:MAG: hypothetical protein ACNA8S_12930, partial [Deferrisomatales bacterium]
MKSMTARTLLALGASLALAVPGLAQMQHGGGAHGAGHGAPKSHDVDHREHMGDEIHESTVEGFGFYYHLIDNVAQMEAMSEQMKESMKGHDMSQMKPHHLMLYVLDPDGKPVTDARLGYLIRGPGEQEQRTMAAFMEGGFGADVDLEAPGTYQITTRVVAAGKNLVDTFEYEV